MQTILYVEVNFICFFLLGFILYKMITVGGFRGNRGYFVYVVSNALVFVILDMLYSMVDGGILPWSIMANRVINGAYLAQAGQLGYSWFLFSKKTMSDKRFSKTQLFLYTAPAVILIVLCILSIWNETIFYLDAEGNYIRGEYYLIQPVIAYSYVIIAAVEALVKTMKEKNRFRKLEYRTLASFVVLPLLFGLIQFYFLQVPTLQVGISLSFLLVFMNFQEHQISLDSLTGLNNRFQLNKYLESKIGANNGQQLFLLMIDIDAFKQINDTYGHVEGDEALKLVAEALRRSCGDRNCFIARYGGDEFVVVYECKSEQDIYEMKRKITDKLEQLRRHSGRGYQLTISIGYSMYSDKVGTIREFVEQADGQLYENKMNKKSNLG